MGVAGVEKCALGKAEKILCSYYGHRKCEDGEPPVALSQKSAIEENGKSEEGRWNENRDR